MFKLTPFYKGGHAQTASWLHKFTGVGVFLFLCTHILDTAALAFSTQIFDKIIMFYRNPLFKVGEAILTGCVIYHAFSGLRLIALDVWTDLIRKHKLLLRVQTVIVLALWLPAAYMILWGH
ncbi:MAG: succinate dehydrogenase, cytochrome b556 subunit [Elusimicrobiota bacterium]